MFLPGTNKKIDDSLKPHVRSLSKKRMPIIVCYGNNNVRVKNRIINEGGTLKYEYKEIKAFACELSPMGADKLSELPEVKYICSDHRAVLSLYKAGEGIGLYNARRFRLTGKGVTVGIVDSGIYSHPELCKNGSASVLFRDIINGYVKEYDDNGHGTFIAGIIAASGSREMTVFNQGIAPDADIAMIKAFDASGRGYLSDIIRGIEILIEDREKYNIKIINLPFEFPTELRLRINPLEQIIDRAIEEGIAVVAPAGNNGPAPYSIGMPGCFKGVITAAGAYGKGRGTYRIENFSGRGPAKEDTQKPDISAPSSVTSLDSDTSFRPEPGRVCTGKALYRTSSGTSAASAIISGAAALILQKSPGLSPGDLKAVILLSSSSLGENKFSQGSGMFIFDKLIK